MAGYLLLSFGLLVIVFSYYLISAVYNIYFHPLAYIPGPFLSKFSSLPAFYHASKGDRHIWLWQNFQIYGPKIRVAPDNIVYNDAKTYSQVYSNKANVRRSDFYPVWRRNKSNVNTWSTSDNEVHAQRRRMLNYVFTDKAVRAAGLFIYRHVDRWHELTATDVKKGEWSESVNMAHWVDCLSQDITSDLCFGRSLELKEPGENPLKEVPVTMLAFFKFLYPIGRSPFLHTFQWMKDHGFDTLSEKISPPPIKRFFGFIDESVRARIAQEEKYKALHGSEAEEGARQDIFKFLIHAKDAETGGSMYSKQELLAEAVLLVTAGSDTITVAICGFFFHITQYPRIYDKVVKEIRSSFTSVDEIIGGQQLTNCTYLRACLDETMRLVPSVPSDLPRTVLPGGMEIDGEFIPAGTVVGHSDWCMGRNEEGFPDANVFRPGRWIVDETTEVSAESVATAREYQTTFSRGPRSCVGKNLALLEMLTIIARTLYRFDVRRAPGSTVGQGEAKLGWGRRDKSQFQLADFYVAAKEGPMLQFRTREI